METGELVSDELMVALIRERIAQADARGGFILDGFPRTLAQAACLETMLSETRRGLSGAVNLRVPESAARRAHARPRQRPRAAPTTGRKPFASAFASTARRPSL